MPEAFPYFFFCYSRADIQDGDPYLERLFEDLRKRVANLAGMAINHDEPDRDDKFSLVGFRDQYGVRIGDDWKAKIGQAIQHNAVLVCLYSPNFFTRLETKQSCGKEFTAFLLRNRDAYYVEGTGKPNEELELRGARNIIPILWEDPLVMKEKKPPLPPYLLKDIQWTPDLERIDSASVARYQTFGLRKISRKYRTKYHDIVENLAERILTLASDPLPPLPEVPEIEKLRNAFWQPPHNAAVDAIETQEPVSANVSPGPARVVVVEVRHRANDPWFPYVGEESIAAAVEQWAIQRNLGPRRLSLDPSEPNFIDRALAEMRDTASASGRALLVLDPRVLSDEPSRAALFGLLRERCRAGLLIPADDGDEEAKSNLETYLDQLQSADQEGNWVIRSKGIGTIGDFHIGIDSVAGDLLARIVVNDPVRQSPPDNAGPLVRPRMTNRLEDRWVA
jgi:hypothetical protein